MSKLSGEDKFIDFSDYGRPIASFAALHLSRAKVTAIQVTFAFLVSGVAATYCIYSQKWLWAAALLMLKNILDGIDGEIARITRHPSVVGRYLDSVFDFIINLMVLGMFFYTGTDSALLLFFAFAGMEFQCSIYNYYYVILRRRWNNQETSRTLEYKKPIAFPYESQKMANVLHAIFLLQYLVFDTLVFMLDRGAQEVHYFPKWFMGMLSLMGLGFQLLIICMLLCIGQTEWILPFFAWYSVLGLLLIGVRKVWIR
jgi:phosphatidylglycerophosphate synthase